MYRITDYTKQKAKEIGVEVKPSSNPKKKIDVFKDGVFIHAVGAIDYYDYPSYIRDKGQVYADKRRDLYYIRHPKNSLGELLAKFLLW
jgi:hypothetical protein